MIYDKIHSKEISFPLGGIGTGSVGLAGNGRLIDWEIFNRPAKGKTNRFSFIAVKAVKDGKVYTKILNGDVTKEYSGRFERRSYVGFGFGVDESAMNGFPHFKNCEFKGEFPIAEITFTDDDFPGAVVLKAFNPFIPLDAQNSSIPAAFFAVEYKNENDEDVDFECVFSLSNPRYPSVNTIRKNGNIYSIKLSQRDKKESDIDYTDISLSCESPEIVQQYWYRGEWKDDVSVFWNEFVNDCGYTEREFDDIGKRHDTCSLGKRIKAEPGKTVTARFVLSWNTPNNNCYWSDDAEIRDKMWKNYYATVFEDSVASGIYSLKNWDGLYEKTFSFKEEIFNSDMDDVIKDAVSSTISVLKSPTVYRLENGEFYGFEGVNEEDGSCEGTCQHVYNYVYSLCFLFPELERSIRDVEFKYATFKNGGMAFRVLLPLGSDTREDINWQHYGVPCLDGQMGCVIKTYREWKISGNNEWLKSVWTTVQNILEYAWSPANKHEWDWDKDGVLEGRQHQTLDAEIFGPSSWLEGFYLAALKAAAEMAEFLGYKEKSEEYMNLYENGRKWTKENLFNGEYFIHKVDLKDKSIAEHFNCTDFYWNDEVGELQYQIAEGSSIDQLTAQWHANILGLGDIFDKEQVKTALRNMYKYNFKSSLRDVVNVWRVFAVNDEAGTIMCDFPEGCKKPVVPIRYHSECMTGFEYQFAGLLMSEGFYDEAVNVVKAVRDRYDGKKRNPWNEIECGSNYVRAMASYALIPIISGFTFDLPKFRIGFNPIKNKDNFRCIWSLGTGWGNVVISPESVKINLLGGELTLEALDLPFVENPKKVITDGVETEFKTDGKSILFERKSISKFIEIVR